MPSTTSSVVSIVLASSTVIVPSLPTLSMASAMMLPIVSSQLAETVATWRISSRSETFLETLASSATAASTALSIPRFRKMGLDPAVTVFRPSRQLASARSGAAVVRGGRGAEFLVDDDVAPLGAKGDLDRAREELDAVKDFLTSGLVEYELFGRHSNGDCLVGFWSVRSAPQVMTPRMSSSRTRVYFCSSSLTSVPPYLLTRTRSPTFTSKGWILPSSSFLPVPSAMTSASCGFSLALSGMMMPPRTCSLSSRCLTRTRSPMGLILTLAILVLVWVEDGIGALGRPASGNRLLLALFVVDDLEVGVDHVGLLLGLGLGARVLGPALGAWPARGLGRLRSRLGLGVELGSRLAEALEGGLDS